MRVLVGGGEQSCAGGDCPTVYEASDGTLYVQGYVTTAEEVAGIRTPAGELVVRISRELFENIKAS